MLGKAIGEFGRIFKTKHNLTYINDKAFRRKILTQPCKRIDYLRKFQK